jgi:uncharacterized caspase-like protein
MSSNRRSIAAILLSAAFPAVLAAALFPSCAYFVESPESRALVVGIDDYQYYDTNTGDLKYCVADSEAIGNLLADAGYDTRRLASVNSSSYVRKTDVMNAISAAASDAPSGGYDSFVFYYAGHGYSWTGYLAMSDTTGSTAATGTYITPAELLAAVAAVPAKVRAVILDSCYSGNFVDDDPTVSPYPDNYTGTKESGYPFSFALVEKAAAAFSSGSDGDLIVLSAAGAGEPSQESGLYDHGIFTAGLLEAAEEGDENGDGLVTLTEAYDHAADFIQTKWNVLYSGSSAVYLPRLSGNALDVVLFK